jgi:hypothetical protein
MNYFYIIALTLAPILISCQRGGIATEMAPASSSLSSVSLEGLSVDALKQAFGENCSYEKLNKDEMKRFVTPSAENSDGCIEVAKLFTKAKYSVTAQGECKDFSNVNDKEADVATTAAVSFQIVQGCAYDVTMSLGAVDSTAKETVYFYTGKEQLTVTQTMQDEIPLALKLGLTGEGKKLWQLEDKISIKGLQRKEAPKKEDEEEDEKEDKADNEDAGKNQKEDSAVALIRANIVAMIETLKWDRKKDASNYFTITYEPAEYLEDDIKEENEKKALTLNLAHFDGENFRTYKDQNVVFNGEIVLTKRTITTGNESFGIYIGEVVANAGFECEKLIRLKSKDSDDVLSDRSFDDKVQISQKLTLSFLKAKVDVAEKGFLSFKECHVFF